MPSMRKALSAPPSTDELLAFLREPGSYPHRPKTVEIVQTHISVVALAGDLVYKVRKSVDFGFLDYSTLERRRTCAEGEIELNRRLCPDVYLGIVPILRSADGQLYFDERSHTGQDASVGASAIVDVAVKMRRLDDEYFFHRRIEKGQDLIEGIDRISARLTEFYREQPSITLPLADGPLEYLHKTVLDNLETLATHVGQLINALTHSALCTYSRLSLQRRESMLMRRIREGHIKDGHGDLRPEHIHVAPDQIRIYDCIEFNDRLRQIDVAADLAFLAMELDFEGRRDLRRRLWSNMARALGDGHLSRLGGFYQAYRAAVRAKVHALRASEVEVPIPERERSRGMAARYARLALTYAVADLRPMAVVFMGTIASGKSTMATASAELLGWPVCSSDRLRKELAGMPPTAQTPESKKRTMYSSSMSKRTYDSMMQQAAAHLEEGQSVILDATFGHPPYRDQLRRVIQGADADVVFVWMRLSDAEIQARLKRRETQAHVVSDARLEDFERLRGRFHPPSEVPPNQLIELDASESVKRLLERTLKQLVERCVERLARCNAHSSCD
jgi:uncharacterized protein